VKSLDPRFCSKRIWHGFASESQCKRKVWRDGWCKQHHPETKAKRAEESRIRYEEQRKQSTWYKLEQAQKRINELELEIAALKSTNTKGK